MVKGIDIFRKYFSMYNDQYAVIGGTACDIIMEDAGLEFRATKDIDLVLIVEVLDALFISVFWDFIRDGEYEVQQKESGEKQFYRFTKPGKREFPTMIELFSRIPNALESTLPENARLTPIPVEDAISSLSAILMDQPYYEFLSDGIRHIDGLPIVGPEHLIPLKSKAWMDLKKRAETDPNIGRRKIAKHKNDVFRLFTVIEPDFEFQIPGEVKTDMEIFLKHMIDEPDNLKTLGIKTLSKSEVLSELERIYLIE